MKPVKPQTTIRIGKKGITEPLIKEISFQIKNKKSVKIKLLASFIAFLEETQGDKFTSHKGTFKKELARIIADKTRSKVSKIIGNIIYLYSEK